MNDTVKIGDTCIIWVHETHNRWDHVLRAQAQGRP